MDRQKSSLQLKKLTHKNKEISKQSHYQMGITKEPHKTNAS